MDTSTPTFNERFPRLELVILSEQRTGTGKADDPVRHLRQVHTPSGQPIMSVDPYDAVVLTETRSELFDAKESLRAAVVEMAKLKALGEPVDAKGWRLPKRGDKVRCVSTDGSPWKNLKVGDTFEVHGLEVCNDHGKNKNEYAAIIRPEDNGAFWVVPLSCFEPL